MDMNEKRISYIISHIVDGDDWWGAKNEGELIRCYECSYNSNPPTSGNAQCNLFYGMTDQNGFCSMGKRRTDE